MTYVYGPIIDIVSGVE